MPHRHPGLAVLALAALPALALAPRRATAQPACTAIAGNLVQNCGFEGSTYIGSNGTYQPTGYTVTFQNGGNNSLQTAGFSRSGAASYVFGDRAPRSATLSQALATTPGAAYAITFYAFNSVDTDAGSYADNALTVMFGSVLLRTGPLLNGAYQQFTYTGIATSTSTTLAFTGSNDSGRRLHRRSERDGGGAGEHGAGAGHVGAAGHGAARRGRCRPPAPDGHGLTRAGRGDRRATATDRVPRRRRRSRVEGRRLTTARGRTTRRRRTQPVTGQTVTGQLDPRSRSPVPRIAMARRTAVSPVTRATTGADPLERNA